MRSGASEPISAGVLAWLALSDSGGNQDICGGLAIGLLGLRLCTTPPLVILAARALRGNPTHASEHPDTQQSTSAKGQPGWQQVMMLVLVPITAESLQVCISQSQLLPALLDVERRSIPRSNHQPNVTCVAAVLALVQCTT